MTATIPPTPPGPSGPPPPDPPPDPAPDPPPDPPSPGASVGHPVLGLVAGLSAALTRVEQAPVWSMTLEQERDALVALDRAQTRLEALRLRVVAQAERDGAADASGATGLAAWLAHQTHQTRSSCSATVRLAADLEDEFIATGAALASGKVNPDQARVIVAAVNRLTHDHDDLPEGTHAAAEAHLLELAARFDAHTLRLLGRRLFEVVCPEAADAEEAEQLTKDEERARRRAWFSIRDNGDGTHEGRFTIPDLHAAALKKALEALTSPRRLGESRIDPVTGTKLPYPALLGQGFTELIENLDPTKLPTQGKSPFSIVITMTLQSLLEGLGPAAVIEDGTKISPGQARKLACNAGLIPMVLDGDSTPIDLGHEQRLFTRYQRIAMNHIHRGCATYNCDRPPAWTEAHHTKPWHQGGRTDLKDGIPLCPPHHHMADHPDHWDMTTLPTGGVKFTRRQ